MTQTLENQNSPATYTLEEGDLLGADNTDNKLATEVMASLAVLEVLERQVVDTAQKGNSEVDQLSSRFGNMASLAGDVVKFATSGTAENSHGIDEVRDVVSALVEQSKCSNRFTEQVAGSLSDIATELREVNSCISQIADIARRSRLVSLNGQIESARAGEYGKGFAVVAAATGELATRISNTSSRIHDVVERLNVAVTRTTEQTEYQVTDDTALTAQFENRAIQLLKHLESYQQTLEGNLDSAQQSSTELGSAITQSIMSLQFQDAVSQRLHHVAETIGEIREQFGSIMEASDESETRSQEMLEKLKSVYCVNDERAVHNPDTDIESDNSQSGDIELF